MRLKKYIEFLKEADENQVDVNNVAETDTTETDVEETDSTETEETDNQDKIKTIDFFNPKELVKDNIIRRRIATQPLDEVTPTEIPGFIISPFSGESFYNYVGQQFEDTDADNDESYTDIFKTPGPNTLDYTAKLTIVYTDNNSPFGSKEFIIINI